MFIGNTNNKYSIDIKYYYFVSNCLLAFYKYMNISMVCFLKSFHV